MTFELVRLLKRKKDGKLCCPHCFKPLRKTKVKETLICRKCKEYFGYEEDFSP